MKIVLTLSVRDEADVIDDHIRYHLDAGVDFIIATDHRSADGTTDILSRYERDGVLHLIRETGEGYRQSEWVTRTARLAATEHGADWVINSDADEFWWARNGTLREALKAVPSRFGAIRGIWRHFVLRPEADGSVLERMIVRRRPSLDTLDPYCATAKVIHRADPHVVVGPGNHDARGKRLALLREWIPLEIFHFPIRSRAQLERKYRPSSIAAYGEGDFEFIPKHLAALSSRVHVDRDAVYEQFLVEEAALRRGLAAGELRLDTRLRDSFGAGTSSPNSLAEDVAFAEEVDTALALDAAHRLQARLELLERRLSLAEDPLVGRLRRRVSRSKARRRVLSSQTEL